MKQIIFLMFLSVLCFCKPKQESYSNYQDEMTVLDSIDFYLNKPQNINFFYYDLEDLIQIMGYPIEIVGIGYSIKENLKGFSFDSLWLHTTLKYEMDGISYQYYVDSSFIYLSFFKIHNPEAQFEFKDFVLNSRTKIDYVFEKFPYSKTNANLIYNPYAQKEYNRHVGIPLANKSDDHLFIIVLDFKDNFFNSAFITKSPYY